MQPHLSAVHEILLILKSRRVGRQDQGWAALKVANEVRVKVQWQRVGDDVGAGGDIDGGRILGAEFGRAILRQSSDEGRSVIVHTVSHSA